MRVKSYHILLTCLIPFYLLVAGCATRSLRTAKNLPTRWADVPQGEKIVKGSENSPISPHSSNQGKDTASSKQGKNPGHLSSVNLKKSGSPATDFNPAHQPDVEEIDPPTDDSQETESEDFPSEETNGANGQQEKLDSALQMCQEAQKQWEEGNPDGALEILDNAYELLISVDPDDDADLLQQKDDIRFLLSKRTVEIYASRQQVANGTHREIPLSMNEHVKREIKSFLGIEREHFLEAFRRAGLYRPMIVKELSEAGLPTKLSWLPLIESYFKEKAFSRARALGLWQFIPSTGCKFGLKRDKWIDERMDPQKSTRAAIEYLRQLHQIFGDWTTVLAAYNCGEGTVLRVIRNQRISYLDNFWDLYERLPQETARYVPRFLAAIQIIEDPNRYGIELNQPSDPPEYEDVSIKKQVSLKGLAEKLGIDEKILTSLNTELRYQVTPTYEYRLKVPSNMGAQVLASLETIPEGTLSSESEDQPVRTKPKPRYTVTQVKSKPEPDYVIARLKKGESLNHLAKKYGVTTESIAKANKIKSTKHLQIGQQIRVPLKGNQSLAKNQPSSSKANRAHAQDSSSSSKAKKRSVSRYKFYSVRKGDYPAKIAKKHNLELAEFLKANRLSSRSTLHPGQRVLVKMD